MGLLASCLRNAHGADRAPVDGRRLQVGHRRAVRREVVRQPQRAAEVGDVPGEQRTVGVPVNTARL